MALQRTVSHPSRFGRLEHPDQQAYLANMGKAHRRKGQNGHQIVGAVVVVTKASLPGRFVHSGDGDQSGVGEANAIPGTAKLVATICVQAAPRLWPMTSSTALSRAQA